MHLKTLVLTLIVSTIAFAIDGEHEIELRNNKLKAIAKVQRLAKLSERLYSDYQKRDTIRRQCEFETYHSCEQKLEESRFSIIPFSKSIICREENETRDQCELDFAAAQDKFYYWLKITHDKLLDKFDDYKRDYENQEYWLDSDEIICDDLTSYQMDQIKDLEKKISKERSLIEATILINERLLSE